MALLNLLGFPLKLKHHLVINTLNLLLVSLAILPARCVAACAAEPMQHFYHRLTAMMQVLTDEVLRTFGVVLSSAGAKEQRLLGREQCLAPCLAINAWAMVVLVSSQASRRCLLSGGGCQAPCNEHTTRLAPAASFAGVPGADGRHCAAGAALPAALPAAPPGWAAD